MTIPGAVPGGGSEFFGFSDLALFGGSVPQNIW